MPHIFYPASKGRSGRAHREYSNQPAGSHLPVARNEGIPKQRKIEQKVLEHIHAVVPNHKSHRVVVISGHCKLTLMSRKRTDIKTGLEGLHW